MFDMSGADAQVRQNKSLDVNLLCRKLEAHLREQDDIRLRRERKRDVKNGKFVPRVAAKQFVATATPAWDDGTRRRYDSVTLGSSAAPYDDTSDLRKSTLYKTMRVGSREHAGLATIVTEHQRARSSESEKRDSMSPSSSERAVQEHVVGNVLPLRDQAAVPGLKSTPVQFSASGRPKPRMHRRSSSRKEVQKVDRKIMRDGKKTKVAQLQTQPERKDSGTSLYRPGDAARRRSILFDVPPIPLTDFSGFPDLDASTRRTSIHALQALTLGQQQGLDRSRKLPSLPAVEEPAGTPLDIRRPKLVPSDRPDWCQRSETETPLAGGSHMFARRKSEEKERGNGSAQDGHLIADAVGLIKQQEKRQRRKSVLGFFKNL